MPANPFKILIVEDDHDIASLESDYLNMAGFDTEIVSDGKTALAKLHRHDYHLVILDLMLPHVDGYEICRHIRTESDLPVIIVSAKDSSIDIIRGLGLGSDDYITKPFDPAVLVARVKAAISRYEAHKNLGAKINIGQDIRILPASHQVFKNGKEVKLANREFALLQHFALHPNVVYTKEDLFEAIWGLDSLADNITVAVHIDRLRAKLEDDPKNPKLIETIWGVGYRLNKIV